MIKKGRRILVFIWDITQIKFSASLIDLSSKIWYFLKYFFLISSDSKSLVVYELVIQFAWKNVYTKYQDPFYLWQIALVLKHYITLNYYAQDCRTYKNVFFRVRFLHSINKYFQGNVGRKDWPNKCFIPTYVYLER